MTRWARAGSTQKHKKMPEDPTPWEEFATQHKTLAQGEKKFLANKVRKIGNEAATTGLKKKLKGRLKKIKAGKKQSENSLSVENDYNDISLLNRDHTQNVLYSQGDSIDSFKKQGESEVCYKKMKTISGFPVEEKMKTLLKSKTGKTGKKKLNKNAVETYIPSDSEMSNVIGSLKKKMPKTGKKKFGEFLSTEAKFENEEEIKLTVDADSDSCDNTGESTELPPCAPKQNLNRKKNKSFFERVKEKREQNGIPLLPREVENRLYRMKKALRAKGFSGEQIKKMARDARRKAELQYRKTQKTCFNCRETGHVFANCPKVAQDNEQGTGICFKCGSTEHVSYKCHIKTSEYPYAKCFVCHNTGHISRDCPENKRGIYPKGGKCNLCGSVFHLRKDCPKSFKKKDGEDVEITAHMINELRSVDDEIDEVKSGIVKQKRPKVVKF